MTPQSRATRLTLLLFELALRLYPRAFRHRYASDMRTTFSAICRDEASRGIRPLVFAAVRESADAAWAALSRRSHRPAVRPVERSTPVLGLRQDFRFACRMLLRQPAFTAVAILTLALGIGANTAVFTVVNGVLLRPLPYGEPSRLVVLLNGQAGRMSGWFSPPNYIDLTTEAGTFATGAYAPITMNLTGAGDPERVRGGVVSWNFFRVLDVPFVHGRAFVADEGRDASASAVILSDGLWKRRFGQRADIVGSTIRLDGKPATVVGIPPEGVKLPGAAEFWQPLVFTPRDIAPSARGAQWVMVLARLKPGVTIASASWVT